MKLTTIPVFLKTLGIDDSPTIYFENIIQKLLNKNIGISSGKIKARGTLIYFNTGILIAITNTYVENNEIHLVHGYTKSACQVLIYSTEYGLIDFELNKILDSE